MSYLWYPPTFLALPLEIRHNIYSYLLVDHGTGLLPLVDTNIIEVDGPHRTIRSVFLISRQVYQETFEYYYAKNTFLLSFTTPYYSFRELTKRSDAMFRRLRHIQSLRLVIWTSNEQRAGRNEDGSSGFDFWYDSRFPKQQEEWTHFRNTLFEAKMVQTGQKIKDLTLEDWAIPRSENEIETSTPVYASLLAPLEGSVGTTNIVSGPLIHGLHPNIPTSRGRGVAYPGGL